jgi:hypothetical protein
MKLPITLSFDDFISLTTTMFESNPLILVKTDMWSFWSREELKRRYTKWDVTITSIKVRKPQLSIWDTVMIVDTWETGYIWAYNWYEDTWSIYSSIEKNSFGMISMDNHIGSLSKEDIAKIPPSLLDKLQD